MHGLKVMQCQSPLNGSSALFHLFSIFVYLNWKEEELWMAKAFGLSLLKSSSLFEELEECWFGIPLVIPIPATHTSILLTALSRYPLLFCASRESKRLSALTSSLPGISGHRLRENTGLLKVLVFLLSRNWDGLLYYYLLSKCCNL